MCEERNEQDYMTCKEILNEISAMLVEKIRKIEMCEDIGSWYGCFCEIEYEVKKGRKLLNNVTRPETDVKGELNV